MAPRSLPDLSRRNRRPEIMDQPELDALEHEAALRGLGRINAFSQSIAALWPTIARLARERSGSPLRVLDLASGGGDVPVALACRAARAKAEARRVEVGFFECDAVAGTLSTGYDVLTSTLFLHHLDDPTAIDVLRRMREAAGVAVLVDDLVRSRTGHALAWAGCRILSRSTVVHHDGPASVSAAFTPTEALELARRAGLEGATLTRHWPQRFLLAWRRP